MTVTSRGGTANAGAAEAEKTVRQTIVETIEAPRLTGLSPAHPITFKKDCEICERRIAEKNADSNVSVKATTDKDSFCFIHFEDNRLG